MTDDTDSQDPKHDLQAHDYRDLLEVKKLPYEGPRFVEYANIFMDDAFANSGTPA
jgi:hypothetical protein